APPQGLGRELAAILALARQAREQILLTDLARIDQPAPVPAAPPLREHLPPGRRGEALALERDQLGAPAARRRSSSRATSRSSKGPLRPPSNSCPCSCPLPAIT